MVWSDAELKTLVDQMPDSIQGRLARWLLEARDAGRIMDQKLRDANLQNHELKDWLRTMIAEVKEWAENDGCDVEVDDSSEAQKYRAAASYLKSLEA